MLAVVVPLLFSACSSLPGKPYSVRGAPPHHLVMIDTNGRLVDPTGNGGCHKGSDWKKRLQDDLANAHITDEALIKLRPCLGRFDGLSHRQIDDPSAYFADLFASLHATQEKNETKGNRVRRVAIIVHGGLATNQGNLETARDVTAKMFIDPKAPYPIFVNWQSNLWANLFAHLFKVRQGDSKGFKHAFLAPVYLVGDLAKGIGRAPATWFYHYSNDIDRLRPSHGSEEAQRRYCLLRSEYQACLDRKENCDKVFPISKGPNQVQVLEAGEAFAEGATTNLVPIRAYASLIGQTAGNRVFGWLPLKLITAPLLDGLGGPAWDTMIRHVKVGFHNEGIPSAEPKDPDGNAGDPVEPPQGHGGISRFMRALSAEIDRMACSNPEASREKCVNRWELTLIGHSMGAIMANEILYEFKDGPEFDRIVFMAAACSVREYEQSALAYLDRHKNTQMYHLTLHDFADIRDQYFYEVPPSGSLLIWIDDFLSNPTTLRDRTAGRFKNLMMALPSTPRDLRSRIHVKTFGVGRLLRTTDPLHHGEFNNFTGPPAPWEKKEDYVVERTEKFWDEDFWTPETTVREPQDTCPASIGAVADRPSP